MADQDDEDYAKGSLVLRERGEEPPIPAIAIHPMQVIHPEDSPEAIREKLDALAGFQERTNPALIRENQKSGKVIFGTGCVMMVGVVVSAYVSVVVALLLFFAALFCLAGGMRKFGLSIEEIRALPGGKVSDYKSLPGMNPTHKSLPGPEGTAHGDDEEESKQ